MGPLKRPDHAVTVDVPVAFFHCDPLGVVWHGRYFEFFEAARMALLASVGLDVGAIAAMGYRLFITEARCRYMAPLTVGDTARVTAFFTRSSPLVRVAYDLHRPDGRPRWCSRAITDLATTDADQNLLLKTPDAILERLPLP